MSRDHGPRTTDHSPAAKYDRHMATVKFGIQVVETLIARREWFDAQEYLLSTRRHLLRAGHAYLAMRAAEKAGRYRGAA